MLGWGGHSFHMSARTLRDAVRAGDNKLVSAARLHANADLCKTIEETMRGTPYTLRPGELLVAANKAAECSSLLTLSKKKQVSSALPFFTVLGLDPGALEEDVRRAFHRLARATHPDKNGGDGSKFREVHEAYTTITEHRDPFSVHRRAVESNQRLHALRIPFVDECEDALHEHTYALLVHAFVIGVFGGDEEEAMKYGCDAKQTHPDGERWILELARRLTNARVGQDRSGVRVDDSRLARLQEKAFGSGESVSIFLQIDPSAANPRTRASSPVWLALVDSLGLPASTNMLDRYTQAFLRLTKKQKEVKWLGGGRGARSNAAKVKSALDDLEGVYFPFGAHGQVLTMDSASLDHGSPSSSSGAGPSSSSSSGAGPSSSSSSGAGPSSSSSSGAGPSSSSSSGAGPSSSSASSDAPVRKRTRSGVASSDASAPDAPSGKRTRSGM
jgi:hypothetical protein